MKQFPTIQTLDTYIFYALELTSSISVLLLAFGLISSMVNVLTKGSILSNSPLMQQIYAWTQCIGIDASIPGAIMRTLAYVRQEDWIRAGVYTLLSTLLLFTACIVSNIESIQQTLNITLDSAYTHVFVPIEALIWIRSIAVVLLIVVHAIKHVQESPKQRPEEKNTEDQQQADHMPNGVSVQVSVQQQTVLVEQPVLKPQVSVQELPNEPVKEEKVSKQVLPLPKPEQSHQQRQAEENREQVRSYLAAHPGAKATEVATALSLSLPTVRKYMREVA